MNFGREVQAIENGPAIREAVSGCAGIGVVRADGNLINVGEAVPTVTLISPVVAPAGAVTVRLFAVAAVTVAAVPLNCTVLALGVALKFCP